MELLEKKRNRYTRYLLGTSLDIAFILGTSISSKPSLQLMKHGPFQRTSSPGHVSRQGCRLVAVVVLLFMLLLLPPQLLLAE